MHRIVKKVLITFFLIFIAVGFFYSKEIGYGLSQGYGQAMILWRAEPVEKTLNDPSFPDSLKNKIYLIQEIRKYAFDSLGLDHSDNYTSLYDQKGKPILWVVTASEPYQLKAKEWSFPILGTFSYKGFFKHEKALQEEKELKAAGWDTDVGEVSGWSTLGWFKDPILSSMLKRAPGSLANLIIHELTHGTLYVKDNVQFNENLASFVGDKGALRFLIHKYGKDSKEYRQYIEGRTFNRQFNAKVLSNAYRLDSLYKAIARETEIHKRQIKRDFMSKIKNDLTNFLFNNRFDSKSKAMRELENLNNTYFLDSRRYTENLDVFEKEFQQKFKGDLRAYLGFLKDKYPSL